MRFQPRMLGLVLLLCMPFGMTAASERPYAGQHHRPVKSLSQADVDDLLAGKGWGFAKPAELNGYPGPRHVLDLGPQLALSAGQTAAIQAVFDGMQRRAIALGQDYVAAEQAVDALFASGAATPDLLTQRIQAVERARAALRTVHLQAHLDTRPLLTPEQIARYRDLRGYGDGKSHRHAH